MGSILSRPWGYESIDVDVVFSKDVQKWKHSAISMLENMKLENRGRDLKLKVHCMNAQDAIDNIWIVFCKVVCFPEQGNVDVVESIRNVQLPKAEKDGMVIMIGDNAEFEFVPCYEDSRIKYITVVSFPDSTYRACWMISGLISGDYSRSDKNTFGITNCNSERRKQSDDIREERVSIKNENESAGLTFQSTWARSNKKSIYIRFSAPLSRKAFSAFMEKYLVGIEPIWVTGEDPVEEGSTCLILCFTLSRLMDDISAIVKITPKRCNCMLVVIHNCRQGTSPGPVLKHNPDDCFQDFTNIIYGEGDCYICSLNSEATETIQAFIDKNL
ncbi:uncharacterized protein LOC133200362 [Saccostrea echinata]|uniref:uncharacterized protein LOC133200362 n=1 Tax=Saccostrea echinata TaxID=191078 RepID=UPI002A8019B4|nr:uncharacterized protein LOC133200362 [Saccostrea echinata]